MQRKKPLEDHVGKAAYFAWQRRVLDGASPVSTPEQERDDWLEGRQEIERKLAIGDLYTQLWACNDTARKIRLAVMFFAAQELGLEADKITEQTRLSKDAEKRARICVMAGSAAINVPFRLPKRSATVGQLIKSLQNRARDIGRSRT